MFFMYILKSSKDGELYIGSTNNLKKRFKEHNAGFVESTRNRAPFRLVYYPLGENPALSSAGMKPSPEPKAEGITQLREPQCIGECRCGDVFRRAKGSRNTPAFRLGSFIFVIATPSIVEGEAIQKQIASSSPPATPRKDASY